MGLIKVSTRVLVFLLVVCLLFLGWNIYRSIQFSNRTGTLIVSINDKAAPLTISAAGTEAKLIGHGSAKIRVVPGTYLVSSNYNGKSSNTITTVSRQKTTKVSLTLGVAYEIQSYKNISFTGVQEILTSNGATTNQISKIEELFFIYSRSIKKVVVDQSSVTLGAYDSNSENPSTIIYTEATIDGSKVKLTVTYSNLTDINLTIQDPTSNAILFNQLAADTPE